MRFFSILVTSLLLSFSANGFAKDKHEFDGLPATITTLKLLDGLADDETPIYWVNFSEPVANDTATFVFLDGASLKAAHFQNVQDTLDFEAFKPYGSTKKLLYRNGEASEDDLKFLKGRSGVLFYESYRPKTK